MDPLSRRQVRELFGVAAAMAEESRVAGGAVRAVALDL
jgi:hypothetical protein